MRRRLLPLLPIGLFAGGMARPGLDGFPQAPICTATLRSFTADQDADFMERLGLLEGHLLIGRRLLEAGEARLALPHFGRPIRELYTYVEARLNERGLPGFEPELQALEDIAGAGGRSTDERFLTAWAAMSAKLRTARAFLPVERRGSARFMLDHIGLITFTVSAFYADSIKRGRIVNFLEYHDSMGFLMYATEVARVESVRNPSPEWRQCLSILSEIRNEAFVELLPSPRPPVTVRALRARSDAIRAIASSLPA